MRFQEIRAALVIRNDSKIVHEIVHEFCEALIFLNKMNIRGGFDSRIVLNKKTLVVTVNTVLQGLFLRYSLINKVCRFYNILCKTDSKFVHELYTKLAEK